MFRFPICVARSVAAVALFLAIASPAASFQLPFDGTLRLRFGSIPPLVVPTVPRVAEVGLAPGGAIQSVQMLSPASIQVTGAHVGPLPPATFAPIGGLQGTFGLWPTSAPLPLRTFERGGNGRIAGVVRVLGVVRVCLFSVSPTGCPGTGDAFLNLDHATPGTGSLFYDGAVGWQGTWHGPAGAGVNVTVRGAPWTTGTVDAGGGLTAMGSAHGPLGLAGTTARAGGELNMVTPVFISTSLPTVPLFSAIASLDVAFTGTPPIACFNGIDDDGDGFTDFPADPGCKDVTSNSESAKCQDGIDNDGDAKIDFDGGASRNGGVALALPDPNCQGAGWRDKEAASCGLGAEIALALGALSRLRRRRL